MKKTKLLVSGYTTDDLPSVKLFAKKKTHFQCIWSDTIQSPTFLTTNNKFMFAVTETEGESDFYMYKTCKDRYKQLDCFHVTIGGVCHILYLEKAKILIASSYGEGVLFTIKVENEAFHSISNKFVFGSDKIKSRIHCSITNKDETKIYATDLGLDCLYEFELVKGALVEVDTLPLPSGSGPRHLCFGVDERYVYILTEYSNEIFLIDLTGKRMNHIKTNVNRTICEEGQHLGASLCISHDKRFLYTSTRGQNCINVHEIINEKELKEVQNIYTGGIWPRHIAFVEREKYLYVANQFSNDLTIFKRNKKSGLLKSMDYRIDFEKVSFVKEI